MSVLPDRPQSATGEFLGTGSAYTWLLLKRPGDLNGDPLPSVFEAGIFGLGSCGGSLPQLLPHTESASAPLKFAPVAIRDGCGMSKNPEIVGAFAGVIDAPGFTGRFW